MESSMLGHFSHQRRHIPICYQDSESSGLLLIWEFSWWARLFRLYQNQAPVCF